MEKTEYAKTLRSYLGKRVSIVIDRPIGFHHKGLVYPINYGYIEGLLAPDGEDQDVYVLDAQTKLTQVQATVVAIIRREDDVEDKLVAMIDPKPLSERDIEEAVCFVEQYFPHHIEKE